MEPSTQQTQQTQPPPIEKKSIWRRINELSLAVRAHADLLERDRQRAEAKAEARREAGDI